jgi:hypothetical protein
MRDRSKFLSSHDRQVQTLLSQAELVIRQAAAYTDRITDPDILPAYKSRVLRDLNNCMGALQSVRRLRPIIEPPKPLIKPQQALSPTSESPLEPEVVRAIEPDSDTVSD